MCRYVLFYFLWCEVFILKKKLINVSRHKRWKYKGFLALGSLFDQKPTEGGARLFINFSFIKLSLSSTVQRKSTWKFWISRLQKLFKKVDSKRCLASLICLHFQFHQLYFLTLNHIYIYVYISWFLLLLLFSSWI